MLLPALRARAILLLRCNDKAPEARFPRKAWSGSCVSVWEQGCLARLIWMIHGSSLCLRPRVRAIQFIGVPISSQPLPSSTKPRGVSRLEAKLSMSALTRGGISFPQLGKLSGLDESCSHQVHCSITPRGEEVIDPQGWC